MPVRPKTRRRLLLLVLIGVVLIGAGTGVFLYRKHQIRQDMLAKRAEGMAAFEQGDYVTAMHSVGSYLNRYPEDVEALYAYAVSRREVTEPDGEHLRQAIGMFRRVMELEPKHQDARTALLELYPRVGFNTEALQLAEEQLRHDPDDAMALWAKARALAAVRRFVDAVPVAENYTRQKPEDLSGHLLLFSLYDALNEPDEPYIEHAERMADRLADHPVMPLLRATVFLLTDDREQAEAWAAVAAEREPPDADYALQVANTFERLDKFQAAREYLQDVTDADAAPQLQRALAHHLWQSGRIEALIERLDHLDAADEQTPADLLGIKAMALLSAGQNDQASPIIDALGQREEDQVAAAWHRVLDTSQQQPQVSPQQIIAACDEALRTLKNHPYFLTIKAEALASVGEHDLAIAAWSQAAQRAPAWPMPPLRMAQTLLVVDRPQQAYLAARQVLRRSPNNLSAALVLAESLYRGLAPEQVEQTDQVIAVLDQIQAAAPGEPRSAIIRTDLLARRGSTEQARQAIQALLDAEQKLPVSYLLRLSEISKRYDLGLSEACLARAEQTHGQSVALIYARAVDLAAEGQIDQGRRMLIAAVDAADTPEDKLDAQITLARYHQQVRDPQATQAWAELADAHPDNARVQRIVLDTNVAWADLDLIARVLNRLEADHSQGLTWQVARARYLLQSDPSDRAAREAARMLSQVIASAPAAFEPRMLAVEAYQRLGNSSPAMEHLDAAINLRPDALSPQLEKIGMLLAEGDQTHARTALEQIAARDRLSLAQRRRMAALFGRLGQVNRAIDQLVAAYDGDERAPDLLLASLYRRAQRLESAQAICQRMLEEQPTAAAIEFAADFYASRDKMDQARAALDRLDGLELEPGLAELIRANFAARYQGDEQAIAAYRQAVEVAPDSDRAWSLLINQQLYRGDVEALAQAIADAHRALPADATFALLHEHRDLMTYATERSGIRPLAAALIRSPEYQQACIDAIRLLKSGQDEQRSVTEQIARVRQLADRHPRCLPLQSLLVRLYMDAGQADDAADIATRAMQAFPNSAEPAWMAAEALAAAGRWSEALGVSQEWRNRSANQPIAADMMIAEARMQLGESTSAVEQLAPHLETALADPDANVPLIVKHVRAYVAAGDVERAARLLQPQLERSTMWRSIWIRMAYLILPDVESGRAWLERVEPLIPADNLDQQVELARGWRALDERYDKPAYSDRARELLGQVVAMADPPAPAFAMLAVMAEVDADTTQAEKLYSRTLEADPDHPMAANNLAMMLITNQREPAEALRLARIAVERIPRSADFRDTLALALAENGQFDEAVRQQTAAVQLAPNDPSLIINLAYLLARADRIDTAAEVLDRLDQAIQNPQQLPQALRNTMDQTRKLIQTHRDAAAAADNDNTEVADAE